MPMMTGAVGWWSACGGRRVVGGIADAAADSGGRSATRALNGRVLEGEVLPPSGAVVSVGQRAIGPGVYGTLPELMPAGQKLQNLSPSPSPTTLHGPLAPNLAETFSGRKYDTHVLQETSTFYRAGTEERPLGQFFSAARPVGVVQTRIDKAIPPVWSDGTPAPLTTGWAIQFPPGTTVHVGEVANQGGLYMGGTQQILIEKPWNIEGVKEVGHWNLH